MASTKTFRSLLAIVLLCASATLAVAQNSVTVAWQNSSAANTRLKDLNGSAELTAGTAAVGDGAVLQLGYYSAGTGANPFAGTFTALTGQTSANTGLATTSVGDSPGGTIGRFSLLTTFVQGSATTGQSLPAAGIPLVIRFYNRATIAASTHFNEVSSGDAAWLGKAPSLAPGELILISLSDAGLVWRGVPFQTSEQISGTGGGSFVLDSSSAPVTKDGGTISVGFTTTNQTNPWTASTSTAWIAFTTATSGTGNGSVTLSIAPNAGTARNGAATIAGQVFTVIQAGSTGGGDGCEFVVSPAFAGLKGGGGSGSFRVIASGDDCAWTATSNANWITLTEAVAGTGSGTVKYSVAAFSGPGQRTGTITVNGVIFTVVQAVVLPTSTLTVSTDGPGSVDGGLPTTRNVGALYKLTAKPAAGAIFNGWTGTNLSFAPGEEFDPVLNFVMQENTAITAHFIVNPFAVSAAASTYCGLVEGDALFDPAQAGIIKVTVTKTGKFTGKMLLGAKPYPVNGLFTGDGHAGVVLKRTGDTNLYVQLTLNLTGPTLGGEIFEESADGPPFGTFAAASCVVAKPYANAGSFTLIMPVATGDNFGTGYATLTISPTGGASVKGTLPDGTALVVKGSVDVTGAIALYLPLYKKVGFVGGYTYLREVPGTSDLDGDLKWMRPPALATDKSQFYRAGFESAVTVLGSRYAKPAADVRAITLANSTNNAAFTATDGDLNPSPLQKAITWDAKNKLLAPVDAAQVKLSLNPATGLIGGSFIHNATGKKTNVGGVVFQKQDRADGLFLGVQEAGTVTLAAP